MIAKIVYDKPGRIRFRAGKFAFDKDKEASIESTALSKKFITKAVATSENGGVLICYDVNYREEVIAFIRGLDARILEAKTAVDSLTTINKEFSNKLITTVVNRYIGKWFFPKIVGRCFIYYRAAQYIIKGASTLLSGHLTVDVLDATSIGVSLLQKNYSTASSIMFLLKLSSILEDYTHARTKIVLKDALSIKVEQVWLVTEEQDIQIPIGELKVGDVIRVRTGNVIPVDGTVVGGEATVNESAMTGEPLGVMKTDGKSVFGGTIVEEGSIAVKVRAVASDIKINKTIDMIDNSEELKAGVQSKAESLADKIVPFSFLGFGLVYLFTRNLTRAISVLMVDYSCAIKLSTPIAVISAIKEAADNEITVKGGKFFEAAAAVDTIVFDKTGTLTNAKPSVYKIIALEGYTTREVLKLAACIEEHFPHSVARAIVTKAKEEDLIHEDEMHAEVEYIVAHGIATTIAGERAIIGSKHFVFEDEQVPLSKELEEKLAESIGYNSVVYLAKAGELIGAICINDPPRPEAVEAVAKLKEQGITNIIMLTGDGRHAAEAIAKQIGIDTVYAEVLPEDKFSVVEELKAKGHKVMMVGDGINDAPALVAADVSVALGDASDIARDVADISITNNSLLEIVRLRKLSMQLMQKINDNYRFIVGFNSALILGGAFGVLSPSTSALLHNTSTMLVCANNMKSMN